MERQQARIRGVAHCIIPQEFTIKHPIIPLPPLQQQLLPVVVVGQSSNVQLSGAPAVVQVLVPSNQIIPNQIPVLVPVAHVQHIAPPPISTMSPPAEAVVVTTQAPEAVVPIEPKTVSSYILDSTTAKAIVLTSQAPPPTPTTTASPPIIIIEETTDAVPEAAPEDIPLESEPLIELEPIIEPEPEPEEVALPVPNSSRLHYSAEPPTYDDELLSNGILEVSVPQVIMAPVAESSLGKLVQPEDDPPEMLHDQEMPPAQTAGAA